MKTALYRHFNVAGHLLYVGISLSPFARTRQHNMHARWFEAVSNITIEWFDTRQAAEQAEWVAITSERPLHNKTFANAPKVPTSFTVLDASGEVLLDDPLVYLPSVKGHHRKEQAAPQSDA